DAVEHGLAGLVADRDVIERDDRRRQRLFRLRKADLVHVLRHQRGDRLHPLQHFDARLRLPRLRGLGLEAVDEGLQPLALVGLPLENSWRARAWPGVEKPRPDRMAAARGGAECASISTSRFWISAMRCGSRAVSASRSSASRSASALSTISIRLSGPSGASWA